MNPDDTLPPYSPGDVAATFDAVIHSATTTPAERGAALVAATEALRKRTARMSAYSIAHAPLYGSAPLPSAAAKFTWPPPGVTPPPLLVARLHSFPDAAVEAEYQCVLDVFLHFKGDSSARALPCGECGAFTAARCAGDCPAPKHSRAGDTGMFLAWTSSPERTDELVRETLAGYVARAVLAAWVHHGAMGLAVMIPCTVCGADIAEPCQSHSVRVSTHCLRRIEDSRILHFVLNQYSAFKAAHQK